MISARDVRLAAVLIVNSYGDDGMLEGDRYHGPTILKQDRRGRLNFGSDQT